MIYKYFLRTFWLYRTSTQMQSNIGFVKFSSFAYFPCIYFVTVRIQKIFIIRGFQQNYCNFRKFYYYLNNFWFYINFVRRSVATNEKGKK